MKKSFIISVFCLFAVAGMNAEDSIVVHHNILRDMPNVEIIQDSAMVRLLNAAIVGTHELVEIDGYRVQIFSSNQQQSAKSEALRLESQLKDKLTQSVYVLYVPPFWKVRVGDFRTADEAKEYKKIFVQEFPDLMGNTYVVRDRVQVLK
ncbi:MAG: SPOR domain-containing protein [Paludibacteraceae bacterium]|nr:SPOR domain-containing protein [Paludibacteraceae bacterium]